MHDYVLTPVPLESLKREISEALQKDLLPLFAAINSAPAEQSFLSRKEAAKLLGISLPTLGLWTKTGLIQGYRIASRVRYKKAELETSLIQIHSLKKPI